MSPNVSRKMSLSFERARLQAAPQSLILGGAALQRCDDCAILNAASAAEVTIRCRRILFPEALLGIVLLGLTAPFSAQAQKPATASLTADLPAGTMQAKATTACLECHEARIILQQRLNKATWTKEVDKMTKWGALVDPADRDALIDYLTTNFSPDQPPYAPQRTAGKGSSNKTK